MYSKLALFTTALILPSTALAGKYCAEDKSFCILSKATETDVTFTVQAKSSGYFAFGTGSKMAGSDMFIAWSNGDGAVVSSRSAAGREMPTASKTVEITKVPLSAAAPEWAKIAAEFTVPLASVQKKLAAKQFIWATGTKAPEKASSPEATIAKHEKQGIFTADFLDAAAETEKRDVRFLNARRLWKRDERSTEAAGHAGSNGTAIIGSVAKGADGANATLTGSGAPGANGTTVNSNDNSNDNSTNNDNSNDNSTNSDKSNDDNADDPAAKSTNITSGGAGSSSSSASLSTSTADPTATASSSSAQSTSTAAVAAASTPTPTADQPGQSGKISMGDVQGCYLDARNCYEHGYNKCCLRNQGCAPCAIQNKCTQLIDTCAALLSNMK